MYVFRTSGTHPTGMLSCHVLASKMGILYLPPANEVCEGNYVFTPVCHSVHEGRGESQHAPPG